MSIMPQHDPQVKGFDISGICIPASEVGGDFYDYLWLDHEKTQFCIAIGDVSGKAMKAAMVAVMSSGMIYSKEGETISTQEMMTRLNRPIYLKTEESMFIALCLAALDIRTRKLTFTTAGFNSPLLKTDGSVKFIESEGTRFPLGSFEDSIYQKKSIQLKPGDVLVLFTDGLSEAQNQKEEFYEYKKLKILLERMETSPLSARQIKDLIVEDVMDFIGHTPPRDDMTLIVVKAV
jgi:sigma-B regulation protein RsbU (phosphoserine phosphatase)